MEIRRKYRLTKKGEHVVRTFIAVAVIALLIVSTLEMLGIDLIGYYF